MINLKYLVCIAVAVASADQALASKENCEAAYGVHQQDVLTPYRISVKKPGFQRREISVSTPIIGIRIAAGPVNQGIALNLMIESGRDFEMVNWVKSLLEAQLRPYIIPQFTRSITSAGHAYILRSDAADAVGERLEKISVVLKARILKALDPLPHNLRTESFSRRLIFLKALMVKFLVQNGLPDREKFYRQNLAVIHDQFIKSLTQTELSLFHYSLFDNEQTIDAQIEIEKRTAAFNVVNAAFGLPLIKFEDIAQTVRSKLIDSAKALDGEFLIAEALRAETRQDVDRVRAFRFNEREAAYVRRIKTISDERDAIQSKAENSPLVYNEAGKTTRLLFKDERRLRRVLARLETTRWVFEQFKLKRSRQIEAFTEVEKRAYETVQLSENLNPPGSNFNPYNADEDSPPLDTPPSVRLRYPRQDTAPQNHEAHLGQVSTAVNLASKLDASVMSHENHGSNADSQELIRDTDMSPAIAELLSTYGVNHVYEITNYSAKDYVEGFKISRKDFEALLDELNVLGIHLYFDWTWDQQKSQILKKRSEYLTYKHTAGKNIIRWFDGYVPDRKDSLDSK